MKKLLYLNSALLLSCALCDAADKPLSNTLETLRQSGATTAEFLAAVDGKLDQVAEELERVRLSLSIYRSGGEEARWTTLKPQVRRLSESLRADDSAWLDEVKSLVQQELGQDGSKNITVNLGIMFENGKPSDRKQFGQECSWDAAEHVLLEVVLTPDQQDADRKAWRSLAETLIKVLHDVTRSPDEFPEGAGAKLFIAFAAYRSAHSNCVQIGTTCYDLAPSG